MTGTEARPTKSVFVKGKVFLVGQASLPAYMPLAGTEARSTKTNPEIGFLEDIR